MTAVLPREWAIRPEALEAILERWHSAKAEWFGDSTSEPEHKPFAFADGVARIPVRGVLTSSTSGWDWLFGGGSSYSAIARQVRAAAADPAVSVVVLEVDSPGGDVAGIHDAAEAIHAASKGKPVIAYSSGLMCSSAYWLSSAASRIVVAPTAVVGSIGVIVTSRDYTDALAKAGVRKVEIRSSATPKKSLDPATPEGAADWQVLVDQLADAFQGAISRYRGHSADGLMERLAGGVEVGPAAVTAGLVDAVAGEAETWISQGGPPPVAGHNFPSPGEGLTGAPIPFTPASRAIQEARTLADNTAQSVHAEPSGEGVVKVSVAELTALRVKAGQAEALSAQITTLTTEKAEAEAQARAAEQLASQAQAASTEHEARIKALEERERVKARDLMLDKHQHQRGVLVPATRAKWSERADQLGVDAVDAMLVDVPTGSGRPVKPAGYTGGDNEPDAPKSQNDLAALANAEIAKAKAEGKPVPSFGEVFSKLAAQHPDAVRAFGGREVSHA